MTNKVIIRAKSAGVFFGEIKNRENTLAGVCVTMTNCRRLWYWEGAASLSELAMNGVKYGPRCKFTVIVPEMEIMDIIEIIPCTEKAVKSIESVKIWTA